MLGLLYYAWLNNIYYDDKSISIRHNDKLKAIATFLPLNHFGNKVWNPLILSSSCFGLATAPMAWSESIGFLSTPTSTEIRSSSKPNASIKTHVKQKNALHKLYYFGTLSVCFYTLWITPYHCCLFWLWVQLGCCIAFVCNRPFIRQDRWRLHLSMPLRGNLTSSVMDVF